MDTINGRATKEIERASSKTEERRKKKDEDPHVDAIIEKWLQRSSGPKPTQVSETSDYNGLFREYRKKLDTGIDERELDSFFSKQLVVLKRRRGFKWLF
jgi:hypothetical protein